MRFTCNIPRFFLEIVPDNNGRWLLCINGDGVGSYYTPEQAADDAAGQHTGHYDYDISPFAAPEDLGEWDRH